MGIVEEEIDETLFWLEFLVALSEEWRPKITFIWKEGDQLLAIVVSTIRSTKAHQKK